MLTEAVLKLNSGKSFFGQTETEYLGFCVSNNGLKPLSSQVEEILANQCLNQGTRRTEVCRTC